MTHYLHRHHVLASQVHEQVIDSCQEDTASGLTPAQQLTAGMKDALASARRDLVASAAILSCQLSSKKLQVAASAVAAVAGAPAAVPTGRRRSGRRGGSSSSNRLSLPDCQLAEEERRATSVVLGSVHELWGRVALLQGARHEAEASLLQAAANLDWRLAHAAEAEQVETLLQGLQAK